VARTAMPFGVRQSCGTSMVFHINFFFVFASAGLPGGGRAGRGRRGGLVGDRNGKGRRRRAAALSSVGIRLGRACGGLMGQIAFYC
jgi:hypothetical protein